MNEQVVLFNYWVDCLAQSATEQGYFGNMQGEWKVFTTCSHCSQYSPKRHPNKVRKGQKIINWRLRLFPHNKSFCL